MEKLQTNDNTFPLIDRFMEGKIQLLESRKKVVDLALNDDDKGLLKMGFPDYIIPIVRLWVTDGPDVMASVSHPEELGLDRNAALFNLQLFRSRMDTNGKDLKRVVFDHLDTVPIRKSVQKPFKFSNFGVDFDMFDLKNESTSNTIVDDARKERIIENFEVSALKLTDGLFSQIRSEIDASIKRGEITGERKKKVIAKTKSTIEERVSEIGEVLSTVSSENISTMGELLMRFNQSLIGRVFEVNGTIEKKMGFESQLYSKNDSYRNLVRRSNSLIFEKKGIGFLGEFVGENEGICAIEDGNGNREMLSIEGGKFVLIGTEEKTVISDEQALELINIGKPLAKLESLALISGGFTIHLGAERGIREKMINALGISGDAAEYVSRLRVTEDGKHASCGIVLTGTTDTFPPLPLLYALYGRRGIRGIMLPQIGKTYISEEKSVKSFRSDVADSLVGEASNQVVQQMRRGVSYGLD